METLTLNDGTVWNGSVILSGQLFFYVTGATIKQVFDKLIKPNVSKKVIYTSFGNSTTYRNYTKVIAVRDEGNGTITAVMEIP